MSQEIATEEGEHVIPPSRLSPMSPVCSVTSVPGSDRTFRLTSWRSHTSITSVPLLDQRRNAPRMRRGEANLLRRERDRGGPPDAESGAA